VFTLRNEPLRAVVDLASFLLIQARPFRAFYCIRRHTNGFQWYIINCCILQLKRRSVGQWRVCSMNSKSFMVIQQQEEGPALCTWLHALSTRACVRIPLALFIYIYPWFNFYVGRDSSVEVATGYGLDTRGSNPGGGREFPYLSRPVLGPTQPPVQWVPILSRGWSGWSADHPPH
jgi:hypothetical protein